MTSSLYAKQTGDGASPGRDFPHNLDPQQSIVISQDQPVPNSSVGPAHIVGFNTDGLVVLRNMLHIHLRTQETYKEFGYLPAQGGWRTDKHLRLLADTTGNGALDIVGFGEDSVFVSLNKGDNTFTIPPTNVLTGFCYATSSGGWRVDKHVRYLADIRNTGRCDIIGFGDQGVALSKNMGNGQFTETNLVLSEFGCNSGWRIEKHLRFLADVFGDGLLDIVGFGDSKVYVSRNNGDGTFGPATAACDTFCYDAFGWRVDEHPRFLADLTGDGKADILGCGHAGVYVVKNIGNGRFDPGPAGTKLLLEGFGVAQGWKVDKHPRFVIDLTGNRRADIIGFGEAGVYVSYNNGDGTFGPVELVLEDFGVKQGWSVGKHPRFVVDLTGDGRPDILGFGNDAVWASFNDGSGKFGPVKKIIDGFGFNGGEWSLDTTLRYVLNLGGKS